LIRRNPGAEAAGAAGYEIALNFNGVPFELIPKSAREMQSKSRLQLVSVNEAEASLHPCRHLVVKKGAHWELTSHGAKLFDLLTY